LIFWGLVGWSVELGLCGVFVGCFFFCLLLEVWLWFWWFACWVLGGIGFGFWVEGWFVGGVVFGVLLVLLYVGWGCLGGGVCWAWVVVFGSSGGFWVRGWIGLGLVGVGWVSVLIGMVMGVVCGRVELVGWWV